MGMISVVILFVIALVFLVGWRLDYTVRLWDKQDERKQVVQKIEETAKTTTKRKQNALS